MSRSFKCFLFLLFVFFFFGGAGVAQITYQASFSESDLEFDRRDGFDVVRLKGCVGTQQKAGCPDLPTKLIRLILPPDSEVVGVSITDSDHMILKGEFSIFPAQPDEKTDGSNISEWVEPLPAIYNLDSPYPSQLVELLDEGYMGGNHLLTLALHPLRYQPESHRLILYTQLNVGVELKSSGILPRSSQMYGRSDRAHKLHEEILNRLVDNKNDISTYACRNFQPFLKGAKLESSTFDPYLIITSAELEPAFQPLAEWKTKKGVEASIVLIDSILLNYSGRDDSERLRNFLIEAYQNGTSWVLLGGDEDVVPIRYAYPSNVSTPPSVTSQQICDLYFSDVDGEWDLDNDGIWGEPQDDNPDIYPDLFVGRVPCDNAAEADAFVEKLLSYEKNPGERGTDYLTRALWMSSDQMRDWEGGLGQHNLVSQFIPSHFDQDLITLEESPTGDAPDPIGPVGETCVEVMNQGWGIIGVLAHGKSSSFVAKSNLTNGSPKSWVSAMEGGGDGNGYMPNLENESKYGIMYSISCSQGAIDVDKYLYMGGEPSVGEFYPLVSRKGGVAFLGYTRWGWVSISYQLFEKFLEYLFDEGLGHHLGVAEALSRCAYPSYLDIDYGHNLFGDPEMRAFTEIPSNLAVNHPEEVTMGKQTIDLLVTSGGTGVGEASVCMTLRGEVMFLGQTDQQGRLGCEVNLDDVGEMSVVATKTDFIPYEDSITVSLVAGVDEDDQNSGIEAFELCQNYPNPFNPTTSIRYSISSRQTKAADGGRRTADNLNAHTTLRIYNILGQKVRTLVDEPKMAGNYQVVWDGKDEKGEEVSSGIYFYVLETGDFRETKKMTLLK